MQLDVLRELQRRGRFFCEVFPGAKASDAWQRRRDEHEHSEMAPGSRRSRFEADDRPQQDLAPRTPSDEVSGDA